MPLRERASRRRAVSPFPSASAPRAISSAVGDRWFVNTTSAALMWSKCASNPVTKLTLAWSGSTPSWDWHWSASRPTRTDLAKTPMLLPYQTTPGEGCREPKGDTALRSPPATRNLGAPGGARKARRGARRHTPALLGWGAEATSYPAAIASALHQASRHPPGKCPRHDHSEQPPATLPQPHPRETSKRKRASRSVAAKRQNVNAPRAASPRNVETYAALHRRPAAARIRSTDSSGRSERVDRVGAKPRDIPPPPAIDCCRPFPGSSTEWPLSCFGGKTTGTRSRPQSRRSSGGPCIRRDATAHSCKNGPSE